MERIFKGEVYETVLQNGGIVFSFCREKYGEVGVEVGYKMVSADTAEPIDVTKNIYMLAKYGASYQKSSQLCTNYVKSRTAELPSGMLYMITEDGKAYLIDNNGMPIWSGTLNYKGESPADIAVYKNGLWACYRNENALLRYNLNTMRMELRIGGKNSPFDKPCDIFIEDTTATVCNGGNNKIVRIDLDSYVFKGSDEFSEKVYSYVKFNGSQYVLLESGLYTF